MGSNARGALVALAAFALYATHDVVVKVLGGIYSPVQTIFFSTTFAFPLALIMIMRERAPGTLRPVHPRWIAVRTVAGVVTALAAFYAFSVLPLAQVYAIIFATPLIITILSIPVLGEKVRLRRWAAVIVGLMGVLVVLQPGATPMSAGHLAALIAAIGSSIAAIIVRKVGHDERPVVLMLYPMVANFVCMGAALGFVYEPMPIEHVGALALMALLGWTGGILIISAYKAGEAVVVAPMQYSQIVWAVGYGFVIFGETIDRPTLYGAAIIIASGLYIVLRESRQAGSTMPVLRTKQRVETGTFPKLPRLPEGRARNALRGLSGRSSAAR